MTAWRFRKCPECGTVHAASEFVVVSAYRPGWTDGAMKRRCPSCGHVAKTSAFLVVREYHSSPAGVKHE